MKVIFHAMTSNPQRHVSQTRDLMTHLYEHTKRVRFHLFASNINETRRWKNDSDRMIYGVEQLRPIYWCFLVDTYDKIEKKIEMIHVEIWELEWGENSMCRMKMYFTKAFFKIMNKGRTHWINEQNVHNVFIKVQRSISFWSIYEQKNIKNRTCSQYN